nr:hypothetical protein [uncultured Arsenicibacter sp.]
MSILDSSPKTEELTFGQKAVGLRFNPSGSDEVGQIKQTFADAIDKLNDLRKSTKSPMAHVLSEHAILQAIDAQMWAVKALTWQD